MNSGSRWMAAVLVTVGLVACGGDPPPQLQPGDWRAVLMLPGGELPFKLRFERFGSDYQATVINAEERVSVPVVEVRGDEVRLAFPAFNNNISAVVTGDVMRGNFTLVKRDDRLHIIPFVAEYGSSHRFFADPVSSSADVSGRWSVNFRDDDGQEREAVGEFRQSGTELAGTFLTPTGDYRYLSGELRDRELFLSGFDGSHAFLFKARLNPRGELVGDYWSGIDWHESWRARRDPRARLPDPDSLTRIKSEATGFDFSFPDLDGQQVSLNDERFDDKVLLVVLGGSWCPNCHDEVAFLRPFYERFKGRGLEVVGLMYEHLDDFDEAAETVRHFKEKFAIRYPLLIAGSSDKQRAAETLPMLNAVVAYPTMIFLDRQRRVRRIYTGFSGPGTGAHYQIFQRDFSAFVDALLSEGA